VRMRALTNNRSAGFVIRSPFPYIVARRGEGT
jgi:hypothetical protein